MDTIVINAMLLKSLFRYDVRVTTQTNKPTLQLVYYGMIVNNTGDDWKDVQIELSTSQPSIGGNPPSIETLKVKFERPKNKKFSESSKAFHKTRKENDYMKEITASSSVAVLTSEVKQSTIGCTFNIPRKANVLSDGKPHKVTIACIDLTVTFKYTSIPKFAQHAYLRAMGVNDSDFLLLGGKMSVFMDNAFVAVSSLKTTSPREEISLFLGVDEGITVEFKEEEFHETKGIINKTQCLNFKHIMTFNNSKSTEIEIAVFDQLPLSKQEQTKVKLINPILKDNLSVTQNEFNNLCWTLRLKPGTKQSIDFEYSIEFPKEKRIVYS